MVLKEGEGGWNTATTNKKVKSNKTNKKIFVSAAQDSLFNSHGKYSDNTVL
jgi:hypothetical protein